MNPRRHSVCSVRGRPVLGPCRRVVATHWPAPCWLQAALHLHLTRHARIGVGATSPRIADVVSRCVGAWLLAWVTMTEIRTAGNGRCRRCTLGFTGGSHAHHPSPVLFARHCGHGALVLESARRFEIDHGDHHAEAALILEESDETDTERRSFFEAGAALFLTTVLRTRRE